MTAVSRLDIIVYNQGDVIGERVMHCEVIYYGHVQGVGFRYTTYSISRNYNVSGYVKNLPDGTVELVVEGEKQEIERFLQEIEQKMSYYIKDRHIIWSEHKIGYSGFTIKY